jgi:V8-like Glu-specific endopeptidase
LAGAVVLAAVAATPAGALASGVTAKSAVQSPAKVRAYWTLHRMRTAIPAEAIDASAQNPVPGGDPSLDPGGAARAISPAGPASRVAAKRGTARKVAHPRKRPTRTHGKVFFRSGGSRFVCSGTVVTSQIRSLVWTAGHCVHDNSGFVRDFEFVPAYRNGHKPFGEWAAKQLFTTQAWRSHQNLHYDVGAARMAHHGHRTIQGVVGARGIAFNEPVHQAYEAFGYPAAPNATTGQAFTGEEMYRCTSGPAGRDDPGRSGPRTHAIRCSMTGGSSGGGWVIHNKYVNGNVSYGYELGAGGIGIGDNKIYGPYYGAAISSFYDDVRAG